MRRASFSLVLSVSAGAIALGLLIADPTVTGQTPTNPPAESSSPPDITSDVRPLTLQESGALAAGASQENLNPAILLRDTVVNNTDPNLNATDTNGDSEPSIAVNPANPDEIVILAFSGGWGANAPLWHSTDGGLTWTKRFTIPQPPGTSGGPSDQAIDYGRNNQLSGTFLVNCTACDVVSGTTTNPAIAASWLWRLISGNTQLTNAAAGVGNSDQPWLLVNRDTTTAANDNIYVAYDDFNGGPDMRVAVSYNSNPPDFTVNVQSGASGGGGINPGHRLAKDPRTGFMYSLWQVCAGNCGSDVFKTIEYRLNRTTDAGATWPQNGGAGIVVATANSTQPRAKFGTVNALLGGVLHAAADPITGDVYYVYGNRDGVTGNNRLAIRRVTDNGAGVLVPGPELFVTGQVQAAIPSVAVASDGTVGVFYYTFDGFSSDAFPIFTAHVAFSRDHGVTFKDTSMYTFLSVVKDDGVVNSRQRVLGDYVQMKTVGRTFYGTFTGNGAGLGRPFANTDAIFFRATVGPVIDTSTTKDFGDVCKGETKSTTLKIFNTGIDDLTITSVARISGSTDITVDNGPNLPVVVSPDAHVDFDIRCSPTTLGPHSAVIRIESNDPDRPQVDITYTCNTPAPDVKVTGSADFGNVCAGDQNDQVISVCNFGKCNLNVVSVTSSCPDFTIINNPFPGAVSHDFCVPVTVRFTPTSPGPKTCQLTIVTDDPDTPVIVKTLTGNTPAASIDIPGPLVFPPDVIQSVGACTVAKPFPVSNTGICPLTINSIVVGGVNASDYSLSGLPSSPIILEQGHIVGEGNLKAVFAATALDRDRLGTLDVTWVSNPLTGGTTTSSVAMCGEGVNTGARVLVVNGAGTPYANVESIQLQRINANRNRNGVDTVDTSKNLAPVTVTPAAPCASFTYHKEYGTVSNPIMLLPGSYTVTATVVTAGKRSRKTVAFDASTCTFNQNIVISIP